jgi:hypothetical protein
VALFALALLGLRPAPTRAGVPECGGLRIENVTSCKLEGELDCDVGCDELGIYKKACATKLHKVCREECTLDPEPTCTDSCTESCKAQCDRGVSITCSHNCFGECRGACSVECGEAEDHDQCMATCEATCDGECDVKCGAVVDGSCYYHCIECCGGSCTAQANMSCQKTCQDEQFEDCEYELKADCHGSCSGDGALFCGGEFVLAGTDIPDCVEALGVSAEIDINDVIDKIESKKSGSLCSAGPSEAGHAWAAPLLVLGGVLLAARRRRAAPRADSES